MPRSADLCTQDAAQFFHTKPWSACVDHAMTIGAYEPQIVQVRLIAWFKGVHWLNVMAFNEAFATFSVGLMEVEIASFAGKSALGFQYRFLLPVY